VPPDVEVGTRVPHLEPADLAEVAHRGRPSRADPREGGVRLAVALGVEQPGGVDERLRAVDLDVGGGGLTDLAEIHAAEPQPKGILEELSGLLRLGAEARPSVHQRAPLRPKLLGAHHGVAPCCRPIRSRTRLALAPSRWSTSRSRTRSKRARPGWSKID